MCFSISKMCYYTNAEHLWMSRLRYTNLVAILYSVYEGYENCAAENKCVGVYHSIKHGLCEISMVIYVVYIRVVHTASQS